MANQNLIAEIWEFLKYRRKYWLLPILIMLALISGLVLFVEGSSIAPFIYTLF